MSKRDEGEFMSVLNFIVFLIALGFIFLLFNRIEVKIYLGIIALIIFAVWKMPDRVERERRKRLKQEQQEQQEGRE